MRIYSNYTPAEYDAVASLANELGFSLSAFQHYCVMLHANQKGTAMTMDHLLSTMLHHLDLKKSGDTFIVSSLLPEEWPSLSRSEKMTLAKQLSRHIKENDSKYVPYRVAQGKTTIYKKL